MDENITPSNNAPEELFEDNAAVTAEKVSRGGVFGRIAALSKRAKIIVAAVALAVVGGGGAFAYNAYQAPDMVVATALGSLAAQAHPSGTVDLKISSGGMIVNGTINYASSDAASSASAKIQANIMAMPLGATVNLVSTKSGDAYLSLSDFDSIGQYATQSGFLSDASYASLKALLTNKWVKISKTELNNYTAGTGQSDCISTLTSKDKNQAIAAQIGDTLRANNFVVAKKELPGQDGNRVFVLGIKADKLKSFVTALKGTKYWSALTTCSPSFEISDASITQITQAKIDKAMADTGVTVTLTANGASHNLVSLELAYQSPSGDGSADVKLSPTGDKSGDVKVPSESVSVTELIMALSGLGA